MALYDPKFPVLYRFDPEASTDFLKKIYFFTMRFWRFFNRFTQCSPFWPAWPSRLSAKFTQLARSRSICGPGSRSIETGPKTGY